MKPVVRMLGNDAGQQRLKAGRSRRFRAPAPTVAYRVDYAAIYQTMTLDVKYRRINKMNTMIQSR